MYIYICYNVTLFSRMSIIRHVRNIAFRKNVSDNYGTERSLTSILEVRTVLEFDIFEGISI